MKILGVVSLPLLFQLWWLNPATSEFSEARFTRLVTKLKLDVLDFAREVEREFQDRCFLSTYEICQKTNYNMCSSMYPNQECLGGANYYIEECSGERGENSACSGLYDFSISTVRIPAAEMRAYNGNPTNPAILEAICSTRGLDTWLQNRRDTAYRSQFGVEPRAWYFGSTSGAFRIWPARLSRECGTYDPRVRPWYVAGGSGQKNVILIIDISGSMKGNRLDMAKEAAERVVSTLTVSDRVAVVVFSESATALTSQDGLMYLATNVNKGFLIEKIKNITPSATGGTNFGDAFRLAFDVFNNTIEHERHADCNSAILFLTDGKITTGMNEAGITLMVQSRINEISNRIGKPVLLFTYSISNNAEDHKYPAELACAVERGVWTKINSRDSILDALSSYYRVFALGLGTNTDFVAWVEPYNFATGNILGTTVSVPVFDRTQSPHLFLGVVGIDIALQAIDNALGGTDAEAARNESINRVVSAAEASCPPRLDLSKCEMLAWSHTVQSKENLQCEVNCSEVEFSQPACPGVIYPTDLFINLDLNDTPYKSRICCIVGTTVPTDQCPAYDIYGINEDDLYGINEDSGDISMVAIVVTVAVGGIIILGLAAYCSMKHCNQPNNSKNYPPPFNPASRNMIRSASAPMEQGSSHVPVTPASLNRSASAPMEQGSSHVTVTRPVIPPPFQGSISVNIDPETALPLRSLNPPMHQIGTGNGAHILPPFHADTGINVETGEEPSVSEDEDSSFQGSRSVNIYPETALPTGSLNPPVHRIGTGNDAHILPPFHAETRINSSNRSPLQSAETGTDSHVTWQMHVKTGEEPSASEDEDSSDSDYSG